MIQKESIASNLVISKSANDKSKQVILIALYNPTDTQQDSIVNINGIQVFRRDIPQGESVMFNSEKLFLETDGDQISITGQINKVVSYFRY